MSCTFALLISSKGRLGSHRRGFRNSETHAQQWKEEEGRMVPQDPAPASEIPGDLRGVESQDVAMRDALVDVQRTVVVNAPQPTTQGVPADVDMSQAQPADTFARVMNTPEEREREKALLAGSTPADTVNASAEAMSASAEAAKTLMDVAVAPAEAIMAPTQGDMVPVGDVRTPTARAGTPDDEETPDRGGAARDLTGEASTAQAAQGDSPSSKAVVRLPGNMASIHGPAPDGPTRDAKGLLSMEMDGITFRSIDQIAEPKRARLAEKDLKPIEHLTFADIRSYNRDQLRAFCFVYGVVRKKKAEMEVDLARYCSAWNRNRPGFEILSFVPSGVRASEVSDSTPSEAAVQAAVQPVAQSGNGNTATSVATSASVAPAATGVNCTPPSVSPPAQPSVPAAAAAPRPANLDTAPRSGSVPHTPVQSPQAPSAPRLPASTPRTGGSASNIAPRSVGSSPGLAPRPNALGASGGVQKQARTAPTRIAARGCGTSFKQKTHAQQGGAKFKAAYNGAGPAIVNIVENAASYFEGKDSPEAIQDKTRSYERYQFNVDMLTEIFDGPMPDTADDNDAVEAADAMQVEDSAIEPGRAEVSAKELGERVLQLVGGRMMSRTNKERMAELSALEKKYMDVESQNRVAEKMSMRLFQKLERAETLEDVNAVRAEFERVNQVRFVDAPPVMVRQQVDKSQPLKSFGNDVRILSFTAAGQ